MASDLVAASLESGWNVRRAGWGSFDIAGWPKPESAEPFRLELDERLGFSVSSEWRVLLSDTWFGKEPRDWLRADGALWDDANRGAIWRALSGARSARDAVAHRLPHKKAMDAQLLGHDGSPSPKIPAGNALLAHCVWESDNPGRSGLGTPTVQHGYARGVVAELMQIADDTIRAVREHPSSIHRDHCHEGPFPSGRRTFVVGMGRVIPG